MELPTPEGLRSKREDLDLTQSEVAERAGVSQPLIARIESGDVDPRLSTLRGIVNALEEADGSVPRARNVMHEGIVSVAPDDAVREAVRIMQEEAFSQLPVLDGAEPVGSISEADVNSASVPSGSESSVGDLPVEEVMSDSFPTVQPDDTVDKVRSLLDVNQAVLVTDDREAVGIITQADVATQLI